MPVSLGYIPEGEVLLEPTDPFAPLPSPPINPIQNNVAYPSKDDPYASVPRLSVCTQEVGSARNPITGEMFEYTNGCQKADILAGNPHIGVVSQAPLVAEAPQINFESGARGLENLVNSAGDDARITLGIGVTQKYLTGVAMGAIIYQSAVYEKLYDQMVKAMQTKIAQMPNFREGVISPKYIIPFVKLSFVSETMGENQAKNKFLDMYQKNILGLAFGRVYPSLWRQNELSFAVKSAQAEKDLFALVQEASMNPNFGAEVVLTYLPQ